MCKHENSFDENLVSAISTLTARIHRAGKDYRRDLIEQDDYASLVYKLNRQIADIITLIKE